MKLYGYFRSSAAYRVRIALKLKGLAYDTVPVHLLKDGGEQLTSAYRALTPQGLVPVLTDGQNDSLVLTQSLAIIEYLDETFPTPALLPHSAADRAFVRSIALSIACDIHPLNNLRVLRYLKQVLQVEDAQRDDWYRHWCELGLTAIEAMLTKDRRVGKFCFGDAPGMADCCLVPQVFNAQRLNCDLSKLPIVLRITDACLALDAFIQAAPDRQPDRE